jgi:putative ABC transport system permease protein
VHQFFGDGNPLGRRVRYNVPERDIRSGRWFEIVGVVENLPVNPIVPGENQARLYRPLLPEHTYPVRLIVRVQGPFAIFARKLRQISGTLDPTLRLSGTITLSDIYRREQMGLYWGALAFALVTLSVLLQSGGGIYALMSFTVTRRRREIGIRAALGADSQRILRSICSRALAQVALGIFIGLIAGTLLDAVLDGELMGGRGALILPVVSLLMLLVGLLATLGPALRGLRIHPTEALREE